MDLITEAKEKATITVEKIETEKIAMANAVEGIEIKCDEDLNMAVDILKKIKSRKKWLEEDRKKIVDPINHSLKLINSKYKPAKDFLDFLAKKLDQGKIAPYAVEKMRLERIERDKQIQAEFDQKAKEAEALRQASEDQSSEIIEEMAVVAEAEALKVADKVAEVSTQTRTADTVNSIRSRWVCEVNNADLVPREFCQPNQVQLNQAVKNGVREIAGCTIKEVYSSTTR